MKNELLYSLSLFKQKEVILVLLALALFIFLAGVLS